MKFVKYSVLLLVATISLSLGTFAKDKNEGKFTIRDTVQVGSSQLKPGDYKVTWEGTGSNVQVKIFEGKNVVATTSARVVEKERPASANAVTVVTGTDGTKALDELAFGNRKETLVFGAAETAKY